MTYLPDHFRQENQAEIAAFLDAHPLATLVVNLDGQLWPTPLPQIYQPSTSGPGSFLGHVALANDMWRADISRDVLVIANGPGAYITPNWYATKSETHEVVPTWNYAAVHAWGKMTVHHDVKFKRTAVGMLTKIQESASEIPWKMGDAPQDFISQQLEHIVGIQIEVTKIVAKFKLSQNRNDLDRAGVIAGLVERNTGADYLVRDLMNSQKSEESS